MILYSKGKPELTVALPMRNSKDISFLAFESLCNQKNVEFEWELIVYEEQHDNITSLDDIKAYADRLKDVGCVRCVYITCDNQPLLIDKWITIANAASESRVSYLLQAADCYSYSYRLANTYEVINECGYSWYDNYNGFFYSFESNSLIRYAYNMTTNLSMGIKTDIMRRLPSKEIYKGIDGYIYNWANRNSDGIFLDYSDSNLYFDGLDTHGHNNISVNRQSFFDNIRIPFVETDYKLKDLSIPQHIKKQINELQRSK